MFTGGWAPMVSRSTSESGLLTGGRAGDMLTGGAAGDMLTGGWASNSAWRSDGLAVGGEIAGVDIPNLQFDQSVYLEFEAVESDYTARLYEEPGGALLAEVSGFDDTRGPDPGLTGLITSSQSSTSLEILGVWDDVTATSLDVVAVDADFDDDGSTRFKLHRGGPTD